MAPTEIWLRLMCIGELWGDKVVEIAGNLIRHGVLSSAGLTAKQQARFQSIPESNIAASLRWLEKPAHHLLLANSPFIRLRYVQSVIILRPCLSKAISMR